MADSVARPSYDRPSLISPAGPNPPPTMEELRDVLVRDPARLAAASRVRGWLVQEARTKRDTGFLVAGLCERLNEAGVPIDRGSLALETLHSEHAAIGRFWVKGEGSHSEKFRYDRRDRAPMSAAPSTTFTRPASRWSSISPQTPDDAFGVVPELKAAGYTAYLCLPIMFANGDENGIAFATKHPDGFSEMDLAFIGYVMPIGARGARDPRRLPQPRPAPAHLCRRRAAPGDPVGRVRRGDVTTNSLRDPRRRYAQLHPHHRQDAA